MLQYAVWTGEGELYAIFNSKAAALRAMEKLDDHAILSISYVNPMMKD